MNVMSLDEHLGRTKSKIELAVTRYSPGDRMFAVCLMPIAIALSGILGLMLFFLAPVIVIAFFGMVIIKGEL